MAFSVMMTILANHPAIIETKIPWNTITPGMAIHTMIKTILRHTDVEAQVCDQLVARYR